VINAFEGRRLADSTLFNLSVREELKSIEASPRILELNKNMRQLLSFQADPFAEITDVIWKLTSGVEDDCILEDLYLDSGERVALFTALQPGNFTITVTAADENMNLAGDTIDIIVTAEYNIEADEETITVFYAYTGEIAQTSNTANVTIPAWSIYRHSNIRAAIDFEASHAGIYYYRLSKPGVQDNRKFENSGTAKQGRNSINITNLPDSGSFILHLKLADNNGNESSELLIDIPSFVLGDIMPPVLSDINVALSENMAVIRFNSNKEGTFDYTVYEDGVIQASAVRSFQNVLRLNRGENEITLYNIRTERDTEIVITAEDESGNIATPIFVTIPAVIPYEPSVTEIILPEAAAPAGVRFAGVSRTSSSSAMIEILSENLGVLEYSVTRAGDNSAEASRIHTSLMAEGMNGIYITGLSPLSSYDVKITPTVDGNTDGQLHVLIPVSDSSITLTQLGTSRYSINRAAVEFESDNNGTFYYSITRRGETPSDLYMFSDTAYIGRNLIIIDDLISSQPIDIHVTGKDRLGNFSEVIVIEVDGFYTLL
jgi:hypothetical protein